MKTFKHFLVEKIIPIDMKDINLLYDPYKTIISHIKKLFNQPPPTNTFEISDLGSKWGKRGWVELESFTTGDLRSKAAQLAHQINPCQIRCGLGASTSSYQPAPNSGIITISITQNTISGMKMCAILSKTDIRRLQNDLSELRLKGTIRHELAHWLDDSLNNLHLLKTSIRNKIKYSNPREAGAAFEKYVKAGEVAVSLGHIEIEAIVAVVDEIKRQIGRDAYSKLTWEELMHLNVTLDNLNSSMGAPWRRKVATRLAREGLLAPTMRF